MNQNLAPWFKYCRQEAKSFKEHTWLQTESLRRYNNLKKDVTERKMALYRQKPKDLQAMGITPNNMQFAISNMGDPEKIFPIMLPHDTKRMQYMEKESSYFTN